MPRWFKNVLKTIAVLAGLLLLALVAVTMYISFNKKSILADVTKVLNKNLHGGKLTIGGMDPTFLKGFPNVSLSLKNVVLKDSLWAKHQHTLLQAQDFDISVNTFALFTGTIAISKVTINQAKVYLFTDSTGYSNTSVFKKNNQPKKENKDAGSAAAELRRFALNDVQFVLENQKGHKLFYFNVAELNGKMNYPGDNWNAKVGLKVMVNSLAFNTLRGSFIKDKLVQGDLEAGYDDNSGVITVVPKVLNIGEDDFIIGAKFYTKKRDGDFEFDITENSLQWKHASALLAPNIAEKLNMFNLKNPLSVHCLLGGNFNSSGDPSINVSAKVANNTLTTPGGTIDSCSFNGLYTNSFDKKKPLSNENSAIELFGLKGNYEQVPFKVDTGIISNLDKPIVSGTLKSDFAVTRLNHLLGETMNFAKGRANINLRYQADIVNFKFTKPAIGGVINIKNTDFVYLQNKINFKNTSLSLDFSGEDLLLKNIRLQSGKSIIAMEGSVKNFKNLYYAAPEKIVVNWQIRSPQLYMGEFLGFLSARTKRPVKKSTNNNFGDQLSTVLEKAQANMHLQVDKAYYYKFLATDVKADLLVSEAGVKLKNVTAKSAGGTFNLNGSVARNGNSNRFAINSNVDNANIGNFFYAFDNFGVKDFTYKNLRGFLSLKSNIAGNITDLGKLVPKSLSGTVNLNLKNGALLDFAPIKSVGKFAFPFRNLDVITIDNLNGKFDLLGDRIRINPMQINSSILNMNVAGIYGLNNGTNIALDVPLRNPKKDEEVTNKQELKDRRMKGIVLHILASDGEDGKLKIGWNKNHD
ncbi:MAG: AsmA family protein [Sphingobacteriaceae bacterium]|nr:MAG: AsmA family protein [Sphingobacteriaceae bacterium]